MTDVLVATWRDGVFALSEGRLEHELPGCSVRWLAADGRGGTLAVVDGHTLRRRGRDGVWDTLLTSTEALSCCVASHGRLFVGTDDARVLRLRSNGELAPLGGFDEVEGRDSWFAGRALVNGQLMGPPLGIRSIAATREGVLLANVHVGGIPRSTNVGASWHPTIAVEVDVHEVRAHPSRSNIAAAACAQGLCTSSDGGATWVIQRDGLHASYCSAVAFVGDDVLVAASSDHFATQGRLYRRSLDASEPLRPVTGLPEWTEGIVDTHCIAASGSRVAFVDGAGSVYTSADGGLHWSSGKQRVPRPSSVHWL